MPFDQKLLDYLYQFLTENRKEQFERILDARTQHFTVVLENIFQPHNANAVIRSCDCFGIQDIHLIETHNKFAPSRNVSKGSTKWISLKKHKTTSDAIAHLRNQDYQIVATTPHDNDIDLPDFDIAKKSAFFFGAENTGLSDEVISQADSFLKIPMVGQTESLNISVSVAIIMQLLGHQLRKSKAINWQLDNAVRQNLRMKWAKSCISRNDIHLKEYEKKSKLL